MYHNIKKNAQSYHMFLGLNQNVQTIKEYGKWIVRYPRASISNLKILEVLNRRGSNPCEIKK